MRTLLILTLTISALAQNPTPHFTDPDRRAKLAAAFPEVERIFAKFQQDRRIPGLVAGIVIDGELAWVKGFGVRDRKSNDPVTPDTAFRIASMTKSFTALAILKLRDEGKLSLEDPVAKFIPELARLSYPTTDTAPIRIRQLLTHGAGFPEDNPWGDQQLGETDEILARWLKAGLPFSTPPDTAYEYSNYGFALLGRIVTAASGVPYRKYLETQILAPLGMKNSGLEPSDLPAATQAIGYRLTGDVYTVEPSLHHGAFGAMGGLIVTAKDLARYVAFHLSAWPPRDGDERGPVRRSSVREMQYPWRLSNFFARQTPEGLRAITSSYAYGLSNTRDCRFDQIVAHSGGLPGFGSYMVWLPNEGVGIFAMANLTYAAPRAPADAAFDELRKTGALQPRELPPAPILISMRDTIFKLWSKWDNATANKIAASNLFQDKAADVRRKEIEALKADIGTCTEPGAIRPENWLRGIFRIPCEKASVNVTFTLAPTQPPTVQSLTFSKVNEPNSSQVPPPPPRCTP